MGRINFGPYLLKNKKGLTGVASFGGKELYNWQMYSLPFDTIQNIPFIKENKSAANIPTLKKGGFTLTEVADTYLDMSNWGKGVVWVNGHNLGRYWNIGPQQTIYLPAEWLHKGANEIVIFELLNTAQQSLRAIPNPILNLLQ